MPIRRRDTPTRLRLGGIVECDRQQASGRKQSGAFSRQIQFPPDGRCL